MGPNVEFERIPSFPPERFALLRNPNPSKYKQFQKGIEQLMQEGAIQIMYFSDSPARYPILAAVGSLQFEVVQYRMLAEYSVETAVEPLPEYTHARWLSAPTEKLEKMQWIVNARKAEDAYGRPVALVKGEWALNYLIEQNPDITFHDIPG